MVIETSIIIIAVAFVALVVFLIMTLIEAKKTLKSTRRDVNQVSRELTGLLEEMHGLTTDVKHKSESLNCLFRAFHVFNQDRLKKDKEDTATEVVDWLTMSLLLINKIKHAVRSYEKR